MEDCGSIIVNRIVKGGVAEKSGLLREGDEILEVNRKRIRGLTLDKAADIIASKFLLNPRSWIY